MSAAASSDTPSGTAMRLPWATARAGMGYTPWSFDPLYWHALWYGFAAYGVGNVAHTRKLPSE